MGRFLFGIIFGILLAPVALLAWFRYGKPPVAVADPPLFEERMLTHIPLQARIDREAPPAAPIAADEGNFVAGAGIYRQQCATCHGLHGHPSPFGEHMYPDAPPLWEKHGGGDVVGVSDDPVGETYWKVANGIRLSGMPSFKEVLTDTEMWQVSLLLSNANRPLPPAALSLVRAQQPSTAQEPAAENPAAKKP